MSAVHDLDVDDVWPHSFDTDGLCPTCGTPADEPCRTRGGSRLTMHAAKERHLYGRSSHEVWADAVRARHGLVRINASRTAPAATVQALENPPDTEDPAA